MRGCHGAEDVKFLAVAFSSEFLAFNKLEMYNVTARRSSPVLSGLSPRSSWQRAHRATKRSLPAASTHVLSYSDNG